MCLHSDSAGAYKMFWLNQRESAGDGLSVNRLGLAENGSNLGV